MGGLGRPLRGRDAVLTAAQRAAEAAHGVKPSEAAVLAKVRAALAAEA